MSKKVDQDFEGFPGICQDLGVLGFRRQRDIFCGNAEYLLHILSRLQILAINRTLELTTQTRLYKVQGI